MPDQFDMTPTASAVVDLVREVRDEHLDVATPLPSQTVADILDHLMSLSAEFRRAATKETMAADYPATAGGPGSAAALAADWREELPRRLERLAHAWSEASAWQGTTKAGGVEMPADMVACVAADELVMHGWDIARSIGADFEPDEASLQAAYVFVRMASEPEFPREGLFGPVIEVDDAEPLFSRALGLAGRDPDWRP